VSGGCRLGAGLVYTWRCKITPPSPARADGPIQVGTWLSLVERTLGVGEVASSNLVVPTIIPIIFNELSAPIWVH
jgi:hypothetical protein